jgi:hypothetical protein
VAVRNAETIDDVLKFLGVKHSDPNLPPVLRFPVAAPSASMFDFDLLKADATLITSPAAHIPRSPGPTQLVRAQNASDSPQRLRAISAAVPLRASPSPNR